MLLKKKRSNEKTNIWKGSYKANRKCLDQNVFKLRILKVVNLYMFYFDTDFKQNEYSGSNLNISWRYWNVKTFIFYIYVISEHRKTNGTTPVYMLEQISSKKIE